MKWWDSADILYGIGFSLAIIASIAVLLSLVANTRARKLGGLVVKQLKVETTALRARTDRRSLNLTPELLSALNTDPRGPIYVIVDDEDKRDIEYFNQWRKLLRETDWGDGSGTTYTFQSWVDSQPRIPPGITLVIRQATPYALHFREICT